MAAIKPFRYLIVYPQMLRAMERRRQNGRIVNRPSDGASDAARARMAPAAVAAVEPVDVVVVGARLAGCAVAAPLARAGRRVVVLDRMGFPSDQLSTHVLMPAGTSELAKLGRCRGSSS